jgi:hypothetical protein
MRIDAEYRPTPTVQIRKARPQTVIELSDLKVR